MMLHGAPADDGARSTKPPCRTSTSRMGAFRRSVLNHTGRMSADGLVSISQAMGDMDSVCRAYPSRVIYDEGEAIDGETR